MSTSTGAAAGASSYVPYLFFDTGYSTTLHEAAYPRFPLMASSLGFCVSGTRLACCSGLCRDNVLLLLDWAGLADGIVGDGDGKLGTSGCGYR